MNELQFPYKVKHYLDVGAESLDPATSGRLFAARQRALSRIPVHASGLGLAGFGHVSLSSVWPTVRSAIALVLLAAGVAGTSYWNAQEQASENVEVDTALLADDLPINAYLDRGFNEWLKDSSPQ
jgi:hypothetical protein